jgi:tRNA(Arg) A34 adenosine deaminase TadA
MNYQDYTSYLNTTLELAKNSVVSGNHPFGAVLVYKNQVILKAQNTVITDNDVTQHAELKLISLASKTLSSDVLKDCTLISSTEPCAMCAGAIYWSGIRNVVFGCSAKTLSEIAGDSLLVPCNHLFSFGAEKIHIIGPINEEICKQVHVGFW